MNNSNPSESIEVDKGDGQSAAPERGMRSALRRANLAAVLAGGASALVGALELSVMARVVAALAVTGTLITVWYVEYAPHPRRFRQLNAKQWAAVFFSVAAAIAGLAVLVFAPGASTADSQVPQQSTSLLVVGPGGEYSVGAVGSADGVPGTVILRVKEDGSLDPSFGLDGVAFHRVGIGRVEVDSILVEPNGRLFLAGTAVHIGSRAPSAFLGSLDRDGSAQPGRFVELTVDPHSEALVLRQTPSRLLLGVTSRLDYDAPHYSHGIVTSGNTYDVAGVTNDGQIDRSYGNQGFAIGPIECGRVLRIACYPPRAMMLGPAGGVVLASTFISRLDVEGRRSLVSKGIILGPEANWTSLARDAEGRVLAGGSEAAGSHDEPELLVARLEGGGVFDQGFGDKGIAQVHLPADRSEVGGIAPLADGKILLVGRSASYDRDGIVVARLQADGELDQSFGAAGVVTLHPLSERRPLRRKASTAIAIDADDRIVVSEVMYPRAASTTGGSVALARLQPNGRLDQSFGKGGMAVWDLDFRGVQVTEPKDVFLGGFHYGRRVRGHGFKYVRLGILCEGLSGPGFACRRLDDRRRPLSGLRLTGTGRPRRLLPSCCTVDAAIWRQAERLEEGEEAWLRTQAGAVYCTALDRGLVCSNGSRHGFLLGAKGFETW